MRTYYYELTPNHSHRTFTVRGYDRNTSKISFKGRTHRLSKADFQDLLHYSQDDLYRYFLDGDNLFVLKDYEK